MLSPNSLLLPHWDSAGLCCSSVRLCVCVCLCLCCVCVCAFVRAFWVLVMRVCVRMHWRSIHVLIYKNSKLQGVWSPLGRPYNPVGQVDLSLGNNRHVRLVAPHHTGRTSRSSANKPVKQLSFVDGRGMGMLVEHSTTTTGAIGSAKRRRNNNNALGYRNARTVTVDVPILSPRRRLEYLARQFRETKNIILGIIPRKRRRTRRRSSQTKRRRPRNSVRDIFETLKCVLLYYY